MRKSTMAAQRGTGTGIKNRKTGILGAIIARAPPRAKIAPEAPIPIERGEARRMKRMFPAIPPRKYVIRNFLSPTSLTKKLPRKYRLIILNNIWVKLPWTKRLVSIVQGWCKKLAGCKPRKKITSGLAKVTIKIKTFTIIKNQIAFRLKAP